MRRLHVLLGVVATSLMLVWPSYGQAGARSVRFERLSVENGLSQSAVNCVLQDSQGWIWVGTEDGLNRFDGYEFTIFRHHDEEPGSLANDFVWAVFEDREGRIWIGTDAGGLDLWDPKTESFEHVEGESDLSAAPDQPATNQLGLSHDTVRSIAQSSDGALWIATDGGGLNRFHPESKQWKHFRHESDNPNSISTDKLRTVLVDRQDTVWVGTDGGGLNRLDAERRYFVRYRHQPDDPFTLTSDEVYSVYEDDDGILWTGTANGLHRLKEDGSGFLRVPTNPHASGDDGERISSIQRGPQGELWVGSFEGLTRIDPRSDQIELYQHDPSIDTSLSNSRVTSLLVDRGGLLWVGTKADGLNTWDANSFSFRHIQHDAAHPELLRNNVVTAFQKDRRGNLWVGTFSGGLHRYNADGTLEHWNTTEPDRTLPDDRVMSLALDRDGELWVGMFRHGLLRINPETGVREHYPHIEEDPTTLGHSGVTCLLLDDQGDLWAGSFGGGLSRFKPETNGFVRYREDADAGSDSLPSNRVMALSQSPDGAIWIGMDRGGVARFDRESESFQSFRADPSNARGLSTDNIYSIAFDSQRRMWIGTQGDGLLRWDPKDWERAHPNFTRYTERDGLPNDHVYGILEDGASQLWLSTNRGLARLDTQEETFSFFGVADGVQSSEFNYGAYHKGPDGELFFGGIRGFNAFYSRDTVDRAFNAPIVITRIKRPGTEVPVGSTEDRLELDYRDNYLTVEFAAMDFAAPSKNRFSYRIQGFQDEWINLGTNRLASIQKLPPGNFKLEVRGANGQGTWSNHVAELPIRMPPAPWMSAWAYAGYALLALIGIAFVVNFYVARARREREYKRQLELQVEERTQQLAQKNSDLKKANVRLEETTLTDPLTGLKNRRYLTSRLPEHIRRIGTESPDESLLFLMVDLDGLKGVNDRYGHLAGDRAILRICELLEQVCRKSDSIIRWGGDEFMVVAEGLDIHGAEALAERIRASVADETIEVTDGTSVQLSCSVGFARYPFLSDEPKILSWEQVIAVADRALYIAKTSGRNAWAAILGKPELSPIDLLERIIDDTQTMVLEEQVSFRTSIDEPKRLVWTRDGSRNR